VTSTDINLQSWKIADRAGRTQQLGGVVAAGEMLRVSLGANIALGNEGGALSLVDPSGATIDHVIYTEAQVKPGRTIVFGRT
jgi:hypothetical protein